MINFIYSTIITFIFFVWIVRLHCKINSLTNDVIGLLNDNGHIIRYLKFKEQELEVKLRTREDNHACRNTCR